MNRLETIASPREFVARAGPFPWSPTLAFLRAEPRLEPFCRRALAPGADLFRGAASPRGRSLLVAFCGLTDRVMQPIPVFLQHLHSEEWDVLVLRDVRHCFYRLGCDGFAGSLMGLAERIARIARPYRRHVTFGTSMGGLPAIRVGHLTGAERGVSIGGRPTREAPFLRHPEGVLPAFDPLCACLPPGGARPFVFAHAADCEPDALAARPLAQGLGGVHLPVPLGDNHNLLAGLRRAGALRRFLELVLSGPVRTLADDRLMAELPALRQAGEPPSAD